MPYAVDRDYELESPEGAPFRLGRRFWRPCAALILLAVFALLGVSMVLFVDETEFVIVENLGRIAAVYDNVDPQRGDRGLHFKLPWPVGTVRRFDRRQQLYDPPGREMFTRDKKNITTSTYLCWKIAEPAPGLSTDFANRPVVKFFRGLGSIATAESRLDARVRSVLSSEFGKVELGDLLAVPNSEAGPTGKSPVAALALRTLQQVRQRTNEPQDVRERFGIEIVDLRLKRINLPEGNRFAVYERMRTERERIAERYRSAGRAERTKIESQARRQSEELLAKAAADAERIRGEGEAEAIGILNGAHAEDPEFYEFQRTLATYSRILNDRTTLVLSASSRLFRMLTEGVTEAPSAGGAHPAGAPLPEAKQSAASVPAATEGRSPPPGKANGIKNAASQAAKPSASAVPGATP